MRRIYCDICGSDTTTKEQKHKKSFITLGAYTTPYKDICVRCITSITMHIEKLTKARDYNRKVSTLRVYNMTGSKIKAIRQLMVCYPGITIQRAKEQIDLWLKDDIK